MNIYISLEVAARELDSKLLLAVLAASKGHEVVISSFGEILNALKTRTLKPGIVHTKSLTPSKKKIKKHQAVIDTGSKITSIDEESGIDEISYDQFAKDRYSDLTIGQSSAVFGWGDEDVNTLKRIYPKNSNKIYKTGSPRVDLWQSFFFDYWKKPKGIIKKPFLLISSNQECTKMLTFHEEIKFNKTAGYFDRDQNLYKKIFYRMSEDYKKFYEFIEAIKYLSKNNNGYDIVLRPHPRDNMKNWEVVLEDIPNVYIIREDSISAWVKNTFVVMHNGCTTAIEATISGKPVITYNPFQMEYAKPIPNSLGYNIISKEELLKKVNELFISEKNRDKKDKIKIPEVLTKKLYIDTSELAAEKIIKVWESLDRKSLSKANNWSKFYLLIKIMNIKRAVYKILNKSFSNNISALRENYKFPPLDENDINLRISKLKNLLGIKKNLECKIISERTILIK